MIGLGRMGKKHLKTLYNIKENSNTQSDIDNIYIYDISTKEMDELSKSYGVIPCSSLENLRESVDAVIIATPTITHYEVARYFIEKNKDVFIEKPITSTDDEARFFLEDINKRTSICMVGHIERFNPAVLYLKEYLRGKNIQSLSTDRISKAENGRCFDVDAVRDLMIHDIDIILSIVDCKIHKIAAVSNSDDLNNVFAILQFKNDIIANLHVNRLDFERSRKLYVNTDEEAIHLDFIKGTIDFYRHSINKALEIEKHSNSITSIKDTLYFDGNSLKNEHLHFINCIKTRMKPSSNEYTGGLALDIANQIVKNSMKTR